MFLKIFNFLHTGVNVLVVHGFVRCVECTAYFIRNVYGPVVPHCGLEQRH